jgi:non-homologous end joining protein Ku
MSQTDRAALGRFVMRGKEYLAIVRHREGALTLTTMLFADGLGSNVSSTASARARHQAVERR